jgi:single-stranded DNA-binding protein
MITVNLTGRLTRDPELRTVPDTSSGETLDVCQIRVAARNRRGDSVYLDAAEWGPAGRAAARCLRKGSVIAFSGELRFRETTGDGGNRQYLSAVGHIEFLDGRVTTGSEPPVTTGLPRDA